MNIFSGKLAMVTGGATGIGAAIVKRLALLGADVACCYNKSYTHAQALATKLEEAGREISITRMDVSNYQEVRDGVESIIVRYGRPISILVNNAGDNITPTPVEAMDEALWNKVIGINLTGPFLCAKYCIPGMKTWGRPDHQRHLDIGAHRRRTWLGALRGEQGRAGGPHPLVGKGVGALNITVNGVAPGLSTRRSTSAPTRRRAWSGCGRPSRCSASARPTRWRGSWHSWRLRTPHL